MDINQNIQPVDIYQWYPAGTPTPGHFFINHGNIYGNMHFLRMLYLLGTLWKHYGNIDHKKSPLLWAS